jgi:hypothetical protein
MVITTVLYIVAAFTSINLITSSWTRNELRKAIPAKILILQEISSKISNSYSFLSPNPLILLSVIDLVIFGFSFSFSLILLYSLIQRNRQIRYRNITLNEI